MTADQGPRAAAGERFDNPRLIAALRTLKVPATVFMTGRWAEEYPTQARSIGRDPLFEVANHSYSHYAFTGDCYGLPTVSQDRMRADVEHAYAAFRKAGVPDARPYFRFPGGCYDREALKTLTPAGVTAVQWDVVSGDAFATDADAVARQVLDGVQPGSVVVMHCTRSAAPTTERAVRKIVPKLAGQGVPVREGVRADRGGRRSALTVLRWGYERGLLHDQRGAEATRRRRSAVRGVRAVPEADGVSGVVQGDHHVPRLRVAGGPADRLLRVISGTSARRPRRPRPR